MLVCQDVFDYHRGDSDLGYYYVYCDRPEDVADRLGKLVFAPDWDGLTDRCHAVVSLAGSRDTEFDESMCVAPDRWMEQYRAE